MAPRIHQYFSYGAYAWLLLGGILHFGIDVVSQHVRGKRIPGPATTLYYGLNSAYSLGQVLFAVLALFAIRQGVVAMGRWPGVVLGFTVASVWLALSMLFMEYREPRLVMAVFVVLLSGVVLTS